MKNNELKGLGIVVVGFIAVALIFFGSGLLQSNYKSVAPVGNTQVTVPATTSCQATAYTLLLSTVYNNTATVPATPTGVGVAYSVYTKGNILALASGTSSSNGTASVTSINCNSNYKILAGDNSAYFLIGENVKAVQVNQQVSISLNPISAPAVSFNNGSIAGYVAQGVFSGIANGYTETQLQAKISAGVGFFGNPAYALEFAYNSSEIQSIQLGGYATTEVPSSAVSVPAGYSTIAYSLPQIGKYQSVTLNPIIITGTLPTNTAVPSSINMYLISQANYNNNGQLESGLYVNPSTQSPLVSTVSSIATSGSGGINIFG